MSKNILVLGAGGFIGNNLVTNLKSELCNFVIGVDLKYPEFNKSDADEFIIGDLRNTEFVNDLLKLRQFDEVYQFAADMGGAGFVFTGDHDADIMHNSAQINLNVAMTCSKIGIGRLFYSSSACMYPERNQLDPENPNCSEDSAYPADPDSEYGWEKLFSERLYLSFARNYGLNVSIARYHNIFGPFGTYKGGREKAPAALCRKVIKADDFIEIWGDGEQTRSFLYIDDCINATKKLLRSNFNGPVNIGSEEMVTINQLAQAIIDISGKDLEIKHIDGPLGVRGRNSDNTLIQEKLNWSPNYTLKQGLEQTYKWIRNQLK